MRASSCPQAVPVNMKLNKNILGLIKKSTAKQIRIKMIIWHSRWLVRTRAADISLWPSGSVRPKTDIKLRPKALVRIGTDITHYSPAAVRVN